MDSAVVLAYTLFGTAVYHGRRWLIRDMQLNFNLHLPPKCKTSDRDALCEAEGHTLIRLSVLIIVTYIVGWRDWPSRLGDMENGRYSSAGKMCWLADALGRRNEPDETDETRLMKAANQDDAGTGIRRPH